MSKELYQGSRDVVVGQSGITLTCISPDARDLLDLIVEQCPPDIRQGDSERFLEWLHDSDLIVTPFNVEQLKEADRQWRDRMTVMGLSQKDVVYGCAYWLIRCSGMVQPAPMNWQG